MMKDKTMNQTEIEKLEAVFAEYRRDDAPGVVVSVQRNGKTLLRRGFGLASLESGLVNTPSTKMRIGSTTKHFACVLALMLRDEGRLSIDEPVARWLPELPPSQGSRTLRQFMTHTGGTRDYLDLSLISNGMSMVPADGAFEYQCRQQSENFAPGELFIYNNGGYRMMSMVIERVLGMPLAQVLRERLFEPLSMHDTSLWASDLDPLPGVAQTHMALPKGGFAKGVFPAVILGEGGIASTLDDMQRWLSHLSSPTLWPQSLSDELKAPTTLNNGYVNRYGKGLIAETWRGVRIFHHAGGVVGGNCQMLAAPDHGIQIIAMTNRSDADTPGLAEKLLVALIEESLLPVDVPADPELAKTLGGDYHCPTSGRYFSIARIDDGLVLKNFGMPLPLTVAEDGALRVNLLSVIALQVAPVPNGQGEAHAIDVTEQGWRHRCERIAPADKAAQTLAPFSGRWRSEEIAAQIVIGGEQADAMHVSGRYGSSTFKLEPLLPDTCLLLSVDPVVPMNGTLRLTRNEHGQRQLVLDTARTRRLTLLEVADHG